MAKKKIKRISVNAMEEIMKQYEAADTVEWNGMQVVIKKYLSLAEMMRFAESVVGSCFRQENGAYLPEVKDFAIRINIMEMYANFTLPSDLEKQYDMVIRSGAVEMVLEHIDTVQFNELMKAIDLKLQNAADSRMQEFTKKIDDVGTALSGIQKEVEKMFSNVNEEDIGKLVNAIVNGALDEEKFVKAYLENSK